MEDPCSTQASCWKLFDADNTRKLSWLSAILHPRDGNPCETNLSLTSRQLEPWSLWSHWTSFNMCTYHYSKNIWQAIQIFGEELILVSIKLFAKLPNLSPQQFFALYSISGTSCSGWRTMEHTGVASDTWCSSCTHWGPLATGTQRRHSTALLITDYGTSCSVVSITWSQYWISIVLCGLQHCNPRETPPFQYCNCVSDRSVQSPIGTRNSCNTSDKHALTLAKEVFQDC